MSSLDQEEEYNKVFKVSVSVMSTLVITFINALAVYHEKYDSIKKDVPYDPIAFPLYLFFFAVMGFFGIYYFLFGEGQERCDRFWISVWLYGLHEVFPLAWLNGHFMQWSPAIGFMIVVMGLKGLMAGDASEVTFRNTPRR